MQPAELDWPAGAQAAVTLSLDDGLADTCDATADCLHSRGLAATYNIITECVGDRHDGLPTAGWSQWREATRLGHEIASHGATHVPLAGLLSDARRILTSLSAAPNRPAYLRQLAARARLLSRKGYSVSHRPRGRSRSPSAQELAASRTRIDSKLGAAPTESFAFPAGRHGAASRRLVACAGFRSARGLDLGLNSSHSDPFALRAISLGPGLSLDGVTGWLERAVARRDWLIIVLHLVSERNPTGYPYYCPVTEFRRMLDSLQAMPLWIATQRKVIRHLGHHQLVRRAS